MNKELKDYTTKELTEKFLDSGLNLELLRED